MGQPFVTLTVGASGVGKDTFWETLFSLVQFEGRLETSPRIVSVTTRKMRPGEEEGVSYYFINRQKYRELDEQDQFLEKVKYGGNLYGFTKEEVERKVQVPMAYAILDLEGHKQITAYLKERNIPYETLLLEAPKDLVEYRMYSRGDTPGNVALRLEQYDEDVERNKVLRDEPNTLRLDSMSDPHNLVEEYIKQTDNPFIHQLKQEEQATSRTKG